MTDNLPENTSRPKAPESLGTGGQQVTIVDEPFYDRLLAEAEVIDRSISDDLAASSETLAARNRLVAFTFVTVIISNAELSGELKVWGAVLKFTDLSNRLLVLSALVALVMAAHYLVTVRGEYLVERLRRDSRKQRISGMIKEIEGPNEDLKQQIARVSQVRTTDPGAGRREERLRRLEIRYESLRTKLAFLEGAERFEKNYARTLPVITTVLMIMLTLDALFS